MIRRHLAVIVLGAGLALASVSGFLTSQALAQQGEPTRTVTVDVGTGEQGPPGPAGPRGPAGAVECPDGYSEGVLEINAPGGQVRIFTCLED